MAMDYSTPKLTKNNDVVGGIFSSSYADSNDTKHEEFSPLLLKVFL
jgi:hypothetical protein